MKKILDPKPCEHCGKMMRPPAEIGLGYYSFEKKKFCNRKCKDRHARSAGAEWTRKKKRDKEKAARQAKLVEMGVIKNEKPKPVPPPVPKAKPVPEIVLAQKRVAKLNAKMRRKSYRELWELVAEIHPEFVPMVARADDTKGVYDPSFAMTKSIHQ